MRVNKVIGNFHIAPGKSFSNGNMHVHDLKNYWDTPVKHTFSHIIHHLRFGPQLPESLHEKLGKKNLPWTNHHLNPLDNTHQETDDVNFNYMYFIKIVPTSYLPLGWEKTWSRFRNEHVAELGSFGASADGSVETHQYSVTSHRRSLSGGDDGAEGHKERQHSKGGIPGVFFSYVSFSPSVSLRVCSLVTEQLLTSCRQDISPMKVINREERAKTFMGFLAGLCAAVGGTLTVAAAIDRALFEGTIRLKKLRSKEL